MRKLALVLLSLTMSASAQEARPSPRRPPVQTMQWLAGLEPYRLRVEGLAAAIERDASIVAQLVAATRDLQDFQKLAAVQKAHDRVEAALKRAQENPRAGQATIDTLDGLVQTLQAARQQGTMADPDALRREILERTHFIQRTLFDELDVARGERMALVDAQSKISQMSASLESAMLQALGTTFDFIRAGGK